MNGDWLRAKEAAANYLAAWKRLREEARQFNESAKTAPGPLTAYRLREQAYRADAAAVIAHRAAWRETHPDPAETPR